MRFFGSYNQPAGLCPLKFLDSQQLQTALFFNSVLTICIDGCGDRDGESQPLDLARPGSYPSHRGYLPSSPSSLRRPAAVAQSY